MELIKLIAIFIKFVILLLYYPTVYLYIIKCRQVYLLNVVFVLLFDVMNISFVMFT